MNREPGAERVSEMLMEGTLISAVNAAEVISKQVDLGAPPDRTLSYLYLAGIEIINFDADDAIAVGDLRTATRKLGLSLGGRACIALGLKLRLPVVTTDRAWIRLGLSELDIIQIRER
jgi:PIN domain nuclease of toxin-antitoxin system